MAFSSFHFRIQWSVFSKISGDLISVVFPNLMRNRFNTRRLGRISSCRNRQRFSSFEFYTYNLHQRFIVDQYLKPRLWSRRWDVKHTGMVCIIVLIVIYLSCCCYISVLVCFVWFQVPLMSCASPWRAGETKNGSCPKFKSSLFH